MIKVKKKKKKTRKGSIERGAKAPRTRALLARGCDAALPIAPPSPTKRNEKRTRRAAAALKWARGKGLRTWARGGYDKGSEVRGGAKDKGRRSDPAES